jgi:hypothetical protein
VLKYDGRGGSNAVEVRSDGSAVAWWPNGALAVSIEVDDASTREYLRSGGAAEVDGKVARLYRVVVNSRDGKKGKQLPCVAVNAFGAGNILNARGGTVLTAQVTCCAAAVQLW